VKLYFYGTNRRETREEIGLGVIAFAVPDIGFVFRSAHKGSALDCEYYALFTLCQFVEANTGLFKGQKLEFLGDSTAVVYQAGRPEGSFHPVDHSSTASVPPTTNGSATPILDRLRAFKKKIGFSLLWVPLSENRAAERSVHHPTIKNSPLTEKLNTSFLEAFEPKKNPDPGRLSF
jgi:hypothetical protein